MYPVPAPFIDVTIWRDVVIVDYWKQVPAMDDLYCKKNTTYYYRNEQPIVQEDK